MEHSCQRTIQGREPGSSKITKPRYSPWEYDLLSGGVFARCVRTWTLLRGRSCDFDDLTFALAEHYGYQNGPKLNLFEDLNRAVELIELHPWQEVRISAIQLFWEKRGGENDNCYEPSDMDSRTWDEIVDDVQFDKNDCRICIDFPGEGTPVEHRAIASKVACGKVKQWPFSSPQN